jgi:predicted RNA-binding Zn ribbon-like protein
MVRAARRYRAVLRKSASAIADGRGAPQDLLAQTNAILLRPENVMCLAEQGGTYRLAPDPHPKSAEAFLAPVARSMVKLLVEADLSRVRKCKNPDCVLYFYDTTKSGTRSWCSLDICGNKLRMAASRERCNRD